ncbi:hypothetical protein [Nocardia sp. NPDC052316]
MALLDPPYSLASPASPTTDTRHYQEFCAAADLTARNARTAA